jgi:hypothetical protein
VNLLDDPRAADELGAEAGEFFGCIYLARLNANGASGSRDEIAALKWYGRAVSHKGRIDECEELEEAEGTLRLTVLHNKRLQRNHGERPLS